MKYHSLALDLKDAPIKLNFTIKENFNIDLRSYVYVKVL